METRWFRRLGPGVAALAAVAAIASTTAGAPPSPWRPPACPGVPVVKPGAVGAWYRLDPMLDEGTFVGQRLSVGTTSASTRRLDLAAESFAAGPSGGLVLMGSDDGLRSQLSLIDVVGGCAWSVASSTDVIRNGIVAADGASIVESRVDRRTRADLGVWRRPLDAGAPVRALPPIGPDARFGPTWLTDLAWSDDDTTLVVGSCGETACRYRLVADSGAVVTVTDPRLGSLVGLTGDRLVVREACRGLPCPIVSLDVRGGDRASLAATAGRAVLGRDATARVLVVYESDPEGSALRATTPDGRTTTEVAAPPPGLRLVADAAWSGGAVEHPSAGLVFGPDGRLPVDGSRGALLRDVPDGVPVALDEVLR
jgi:hypothetical protein